MILTHFYKYIKHEISSISNLALILFTSQSSIQSLYISKDTIFKSISSELQFFFEEKILIVWPRIGNGCDEKQKTKY